MDRVISGLLATFSSNFQLDSLAEDKRFEYFCTYCVLCREYAETFNIDDVIVAGGNDLGLDGIAFIVNGSLVTGPEEVEDLVAANGYLDAEFIFVQSKSASNFNGAEMSNFAHGVKDFFSDTPRMPRNTAVNQYAQLQELIFAKSARMSKGNPICKLYYASTGKWLGDPQLLARIESEKKDILDTELFRDVLYVPLGAMQLQDLYRQTLSKVSAEFNFVSRVTVPPIEGVAQAFIGLIPATEYLKLISDEEGNVRKSVFYDNVRDFQKDNDVNKGITETLKSSFRDRFCLLNNGVTIVSKELRATGDKFVVGDYQVVNGCQTSHVLFQNKEYLSEKVYLPIKLIQTVDDAATNAVVKATNSQTPVKAEELLALSDFQKRLETYYASAYQDPHKKLFYERRSRQYSDVQQIEKVRIVTIATQIKAFASMFLDQPHAAGRSYGNLLKSIGDRIFVPEHQLIPYYTSAFALYRLEYFIRRGSIDSAYRRCRYHILTLFRMQQEADPRPALTANQIEKYCEKLLTILWDDSACLNAFREALAVIESCNGTTIGLDRIRTAEFTNDLWTAFYGV